MSTTVTNTAPTYLKDARISKGYANRGMASTAVPFSPETIGRHERGEIALLPEDAIIYAECYGRNDILIRYCASCSIGRALNKALEERDFTVATLRLCNRLIKAVEIARTLMAIADEGCVRENDRNCFINALRECKEISTSIKELKLWAFTTGITTPEEIKETASRVADRKAVHARVNKMN